MARPKGIPFSENDESMGYAEFSVDRTSDKKIKILRLLLVLFYLVFAVAYCALFLGVWKMGSLIAILPLLLFILWLVTWKSTKRGYTYIVCRGQFYIYRVNGYNRAKEVFRAKISECDRICPAYEKGVSTEISMDFSAGRRMPDLYIGVFPSERGKVTVYFTAAAKLLSSLRYYGGDRIIISHVSH